MADLWPPNEATFGGGKLSSPEQNRRNLKALLYQQLALSLARPFEGSANSSNVESNANS
jgi:hypothetical protein